MKTTGLLALLLALLSSPLPAQAGAPAYPAAARGGAGDTLHGVYVPDPYRWLEDSDAAQTRQWIEQENRVTDAVLTNLPQRKAYTERLRELWNFERYGLPVEEGGRYVYAKNTGLQNQSVLYTTLDPERPGTVLLDPNSLSKDGTVALAGFVLSPDGRYLAYGLASGGSDWNEWHVRETATGKDLPDILRWVKFTRPAWTRDSTGFFYGRYAEPEAGKALAATNFNQKLYYHRLHDEQKSDTLVYERPDHKDWGFQPEVTEDGRYLVISVSQGTERKNRVFVQRLGGGEERVVELIAEADAAYNFVGNVGELFWFHTDLEAPRGRIIGIDLAHAARAGWREIVPESESVIESASAVGGRFIVRYMKDAQSEVRMFQLDGKALGKVALPGVGTASGFGGKLKDSSTYFAFTSFSQPATLYRFDIARNEAKVFKAPKLAFDPSRYLTRQVFFVSRDGTRVPMFISHRKDVTPNGATPTYLYGYGGFDISLTPWFSVPHLAWMEQGGVLAVPNLRGGGEYGTPWHEAAIKAKKQTTFDDCIAAAQWLIDNGVTRSDRLALGGGSNGGLLVAAVVNQRPDLFAAALPQVGVMDMLRFHRYTIGWAWTSDYGSPDNAEEFRALLAYSPIHNIRQNRAYPATLITTGDHDDRVVPAHSFKYAATLQAAQGGPAPVLIRIETRAGHGAGKPTDKQIAEAADRLSFMEYSLGATAAR